MKGWGQDAFGPFRPQAGFRCGQITFGAMWTAMGVSTILFSAFYVFQAHVGQEVGHALPCITPSLATASTSQGRPVKSRTISLHL
jgi:hypothetical protein